MCVQIQRFLYNSIYEKYIKDFAHCNKLVHVCIYNSVSVLIKHLHFTF